MIAALWSNSNWDEEQGSHRKRVIADLVAQHDEAIEAIEAALSPAPVEEDEMMSNDNPFFAAAERGLQKIEVEGTHVKNQPPEEEIDYMRGLDQA